MGDTVFDEDTLIDLMNKMDNDRKSRLIIIPEKVSEVWVPFLELRRLERLCAEALKLPDSIVSTSTIKPFRTQT